ncbi:MAG: CCA tRNA nucleotidyltransferase [Gemmatimonadota bacterium]
MSPAGPTEDAAIAGLAPPESFLEMADALEARGYQAWAVGGAIRDHLLGHRRGDWDLATDAHPQEVQHLFRRTVPLGIEHGTVGVLADDGTMYEVTTFRRDVETDGRHAVVDFAETIEEDLARRDFTINAIAWQPRTNEIRDPSGGRADLAAGILRAVGEPSERFAEDYLRVLRGLRFAGRYDLLIDPPTREALDEAVPGLSRLSAERVREELEKIMAAPAPSTALRLYRDTRALAIWYPELDAAADTPAWDAALGAIDALREIRPLLRVARLLLVVPGAGEEPDAGEEPITQLLERLKFSGAATRRILELRRHYLPFVNPLDSAAQLREWLSEVGPGGERDLFRLHFAAARGAARAAGSAGSAGEASSGKATLRDDAGEPDDVVEPDDAGEPDEAARGLVYVWRRVHDERLSGVPIDRSDLAVDGNDMLALGVEPGPFIGLLLDELHAIVLEDPDLNERESLLDRARELIELAGMAGADAE